MNAAIGESVMKGKWALACYNSDGDTVWVRRFASRADADTHRALIISDEKRMGRGVSEPYVWEA